MTDKDTREDDATRGEGLPVPDGSRSEGRPPAREPEPAPEPAPPATSETPELAAPDLDPVGFEPIAGETVPEQPPAEGLTNAPAFDLPTEPVDDSAPEVESNDAEPVGTQPSDGEAWHSAIADALAEREGAPEESQDAPEIGPPQSEASPTERPFMTWIELAPEPESVPQPDETRDAGHGTKPQDDPPPTTLEPAPVQPEPEVPAVAAGEAPAPPTPSPEPASLPDATPNREADGPSFTAAAEDLFRPSPSETTREPHLITLGRRLDPSLRIPRPVPPLIAQRREPATADVPRWRDLPWQDRLRTAARYALYAVGGYLAFVLVLILLFRFVNPPGSMLMLTQFLTGTSIDRTWVPLGSISPHLVRAVIVSEDGRFCEHSGIDTAAIREAIERANRGTPRGASTISMQVTKNMFLWNAKSYVRKVIEIPLTLIMELVWPKQRILEVYLNVAEWGPGIFGAEAAARHHFNKSAARLNEREAALLASVLPNPVVRNAGSPGRQTSAKARVVQSRMRAYGAVASCVTAHAGKAPAAAPATTRPRTIRKPPDAPANRTPPPRKKQQQPDDAWAPTLNFGQP